MSVIQFFKKPGIRGLFLLKLVTFPGFLFAQNAAEKEETTSDSKLVRKAEIRLVQPIKEDSFRIYLSVFEESDGNRYPITTIDSKSISFFVNADQKKSFPVYSLQRMQDFKDESSRVLMVGFDNSSLTQGQYLTEMKKATLQILNGVAAKELSVFTFGGATLKEIASISVDHQDNLNSITKKILSVESENSSVQFSNALCHAAEKVESLNLGKAIPENAQKVLILFTDGQDNPSSPKSKSQACWKKLEDQKVQVYTIFFDLTGDLGPDLLTANTNRTGGYSHYIGDSFEHSRAAQVVVQNMLNEFVVDTKLSDVKQDGTPQQIQAKVSHYDHVFKSKPFSITLDKPNYWPLVAFAVGILLIVIFVVIFWRLRKKVCKTCGKKVDRNFSDCGFTQPKYVGHLTVLTNRQAGMKFPLLEGENFIGSSYGLQARIMDEKVSKKHAKITVLGRKALFEDLGSANGSLVNGWPTTHPRFLSHGTLVKVGDTVLKFEVKDA